MKIVIGIVVSLLILFTFLLVSLSLKSKYRSAFEADQACHFELSALNSSEAGCDHDTETRQWILFDSAKSNQPADVMKRYRY
ncbi:MULTISPECIES: hypothetical protein [Prochlorococcus]|uniref:Uncharacterized protein n=1 Tax=Prochlorococcus marinus (strain SARG / CCMP1375 / SS120) TaxID=167539 RepID=Q7VAR0_PROMA|nr:MULTISPECIES: hypothetical protein [Prochlorococcus]AAQ00441.1 Predicted protein [Prochlorococcus marinus subsp. marinus str. CCMP1375]KGG14322.1 hypothetical protein EV04_0175 [Prochlorococcus marinus str. LG]KGG22104.1 hypothetical protein EV08_0278 [Prochlorococcus marinus str. SS2]KGG24578.1 hypothetical protein EV09_0210 [Prochlorococcus marinus str. SS35]KGG33471.1 hypothetical protein EV10_0680 [Prochlorococcus marinus str. SS51]